MNANVGSADRIVRVVAGITVIAAGLYFKSWWGAIGVVPLLTAVLSWCPVYQLLGLSTSRVKET
jgi:hypothetical protein